MSAAVTRLFEDASLDKMSQRISRLTERSLWNGVVLFGAGNTGRLIAARCAAADIKVLGFVDDVRGGQGQAIAGLPVLSRSEALAEFGADVTVVVCIYKVGCFFPKLRAGLTASGFNAVCSLPDFARAYPAALMPFHFFSDLATLSDHRDDIAAVYDLLADETSKAVLLRWVGFRLTHDYDGMDQFDAPIYFPSFIPRADADRFVFVDCGAYDGNSIEALLGWRSGLPAQVVAFEPDTGNFARMQRRLAPRIESGLLTADLQCAVAGAEPGTVRFSETGDEGAHINPHGAQEIAVDTVDGVWLGTRYGPTTSSMTSKVSRPMPSPAHGTASGRTALHSRSACITGLTICGACR